MISRRYQRIILACAVFWAFIYGLLHISAPSIGEQDSAFPEPATPVKLGNSNDDQVAIGKGTVSDTKHEDEERVPLKELVVASLAGDDTSWLDDYFSDWTRNVYVVNNLSAPLTVPINKGREAMPFLTYILDRYDTLPDVSIFIHSLRYQWHNEDPMYDGVPVLKRLRTKHVQKRGYVALRCSWTMGCPSELHPLDPSDKSDDRSQNERAYSEVFRQLFPGEAVPAVVGAHCSSQFAVSRERIHARTKQDYQKIHDWLVETELPDQISGRVIEYMWHIIFGMPAVDCQDAGECFCETFGLCNLTCTKSGCEKRYILPQFATIPKGWPEVGPGTNGWPAAGWAD